jgi:hypothetical protein
VASFAFNKKVHDTHIAEQARIAHKYFSFQFPSAQSFASVKLLTADCDLATNALSVFLNDTSSPCTNLSMVFDNNYTTAELLPVLTSICASNCFAQFIQLTDDVAAKCRGQPIVAQLPPREQLRQLQNLTCMQESGTFCYLSLKDFFNAVDAADNNAGPGLTDQVLTNGCTTCTLNALKAFLHLAGDPFDLTVLAFAHVDLICMRRADTWCALQWNTVDAIFQANTTTNNLPTVCHPCTFAYLHRFKWIYQTIYEVKLVLTPLDPNNTVVRDAARSLSLALTTLGYACVKDLSGDYCYPQLAQYPSGWADGYCNGSQVDPRNPGCPAACKTAVNNMLADVGCCAGTQLAFAKWACAVAQFYGQPACSPDPYAIQTILKTLCNIDFPMGCVATKARILGTVVFHNLAYDWCSANLTRCGQFVRRVLQYRSGIQDDTSLDVTSFNADSSASRRLLVSSTSSGNVQVTFVSKGENFADLSNMQADLNNEGAGNTAFMQVSPDAKQQDQQPITLEANAHSSGSVASPTFFLVVLLLALGVVRR